jgi:hypothetical protein
MSIIKKWFSRKKPLAMLARVQYKDGMEATKHGRRCKATLQKIDALAMQTVPILLLTY